MIPMNTQSEDNMVM